MEMIGRLALSILSSLSAVFAQTLCTEMSGIFPADRGNSDPDIVQHQRFEFRRCAAGDIQVLAFETHSRKPEIVIQTRDVWPRQVVIVDNILVLQTVGGASSIVYIFRFHHHKAMRVIECESSEDMRVTIERDGRRVRVVVPANVRTRDPARTYELAIE